MQTQDLLDYVAELLNDEGLDAWHTPFLLHVINEGMIRLAYVLPMATAKRGSFPVESGTLQSLPDDEVLKIIKVEALLDEQGTVVSTLRQSSTAELQGMDSSWMEQSCALADFWLPDESDHRAFWLYPAPTDSVKVRVLYSSSPPTLTQASGEISWKPEYVTNLINFVLARAYEREGTHPDKASYYYQLATNELGITQQIDRERKQR